MTDADPSLAQQIRSGDYERFLAIQLARPEQRPGLYALTAFAGEIARIAGQVHEPMIGHIRLAWWREGVEEIITGATVRPHPVLQVLVPLYAAAPELFGELLAMIDARTAEFEAEPWADAHAWCAYLDATAGALHRSWARMLMADISAEMLARIGQDARAYATSGLLGSIPHMAAHDWCGFAHRQLQEAALSTLLPGAALQAWVKTMAGEAAQCLTHAPYPKALQPLAGLAALAQLRLTQLRAAAYDPYALVPARLTQVWRMIRIKFL